MFLICTELFVWCSFSWCPGLQQLKYVSCRIRCQRQTHRQTWTSECRVQISRHSRQGYVSYFTTFVWCDFLEDLQWKYCKTMFLPIRYWKKYYCLTIRGNKCYLVSLSVILKFCASCWTLFRTWRNATNIGILKYETPSVNYETMLWIGSLCWVKYDTKFVVK